MGALTDDMDTKSVGLVLTALGRELADLVPRCERGILLVIRGLGGSRGACTRERKVAPNRVVSEVYSLPRVASAAELLPPLATTPGASLDITVDQENGEQWDSDVLGDRQNVRNLYEEQMPLHLVGSAVCTALSARQAMNEQRRGPEVLKRERTRAMVHLRFVCELCPMQLDEGRHFPHEHRATSRKESCVQDICSHPGVGRIINRQCQFGQRHEGEPVMKPT